MRKLLQLLPCTKSILIASGLAISLTACATVKSSSDQSKAVRGIAIYKSDARLGDRVSSIRFSGSIDGFRSNEKDTVIIEGVGRKEYMVSTRGCYNLDRAMAIAIEQRETSLRRGSVLIVSQSVMGFAHDTIGQGPERCFIDEIYTWNKNAVQDADEAGPAG